MSDFGYCASCEEEPAGSHVKHDSDDPSCDSWRRGKRRSCDHFLCGTCWRKREGYDGPSDDELSEFYGGGGARPMSEQVREAAETKRRTP